MPRMDGMDAARRSPLIVSFVCKPLPPVVKVVSCWQVAWRSRPRVGQIFGVVLLVLCLFLPKSERFLLDALALGHFTDKRLNVVRERYALRMCQPTPANMNRLL